MNKTLTVIQAQLAGLTMAMLAAIAVGCGSANEAATAAASTMTISGQVSVPSTLMARNASVLESFDNPVAMAAACSDGFIYQVRCVGFGATVAAGEGIVSCGSGATSGGFSIAGMPVGEPIGCFIRRSNDGATYKTLGTIELPAQSLGGTSGTIVAGGNMEFNVTISSSGSIEAAVVKDSRTATTVSAEPTSINGIYNLECKSQAATGGANSGFNQVMCKCFLGDTSVYNTGSGDEHENCIADNASQITATSLKVDMNIYKALSTSGMTGDNGQVIVPAGGTLYGVSIWGVNNSGSSLRGSGGEGLPNFGGAVTWQGTQATTPIAWRTTLINNGSVSYTPGSVPVQSANVGSWMTWLSTMVSGSTGFTCTWGDNSNKANDAGCLAEFAEIVLGADAESYNLPRVHVDRECAHSGCIATLSKARVHVDGMNYRYGSWGEVTTNITGGNGVGPSPKGRYVMEQWTPLPGGAGAFKQKNEYSRWYRCSNTAAPGIDVVDSGCTGEYNALICHVREEMGFTFGNNGSIIFENRTTLGGFNTMFSNTASGSFNGYSKCQSMINGADGLFKVNATKL